MKKSFTATIAAVFFATSTYVAFAGSTAQDPCLADGNNAFAFDLYAQLNAGDDNLFFSPYSVSSAMAMMYAGAYGNTAAEIKKTMHYSLDREPLLRAFASKNIALETSNSQDAARLMIANSLWPQKGHPFLPEYLTLMDRVYSTTITPLDYVNDPEASRQVVNQWVEDKTQNRIKDLIPECGIDASTRLVLANATCFLGRWKIQFDPDNTDIATFHTSSNESVRVSMMSQYGSFRYGETEDLLLLEMPYSGDELSMLILFPKEMHGLSTVEKKLSVKNLKQWRKSLIEKKIDVYLPKFTFAGDTIDLCNSLKILGMIDACRYPAADFSKMTGPNNQLFIGNVFHKALIDVNEEGETTFPEPRALTIVCGRSGCSFLGPPVFRADHPFLFLIQENKTGNILFMGRLTNPPEGQYSLQDALDDALRMEPVIPKEQLLDEIKKPL